MKKLDSYKDLRKGRVYNRVYVGDNKAYARINGKETFRVLETSPMLHVSILFDQFGDPLQQDLGGRNGPTFTDPVAAFRDFEIFEPKDESEWFKKSVRVASLAEAIALGLDPAEIRGKRLKTDGFTPRWSADSKTLAAVYGRFSVEDKTPQPYLQTIFVVWESWEQLKADYAAYDTIVK